MNESELVEAINNLADAIHKLVEIGDIRDQLTEIAEGVTDLSKNGIETYEQNG